MKRALPGCIKPFGYFCALPLLLQLACSPAFATVDGQPNKTLQLQVAEKTVLFLPRSLRDLIHRNQESFERGVTSLSMDHFLSPSDRTRLEDRLLERVKLTIQLLDSRPKFAEVANSLGTIASMVLYLGLPEGRDLRKEDFQFLLDYGAQNTANFPLVVYDRSDELPGTDSLLNLIKAIRARRATLSERFLMAYPQIVLERLGDRMNPRSALFGISSLLFSHSINDLARIWCQVWKAANGDMSGMPAIP
jgi:hypothetical protein